MQIFGPKLGQDGPEFGQKSDPEGSGTPAVSGKASGNDLGRILSRFLKKSRIRGDPKIDVFKFKIIFNDFG